MPEIYANKIPLLNALVFFFAAIYLLWKTKSARSSHLKNIFWAFIAFAMLKSTSIFAGLFISFFPSGKEMLVNNMMPAVILDTLHEISYVISNVFLFHFGISIIAFKTSLRIDFKIFPVLLFVAFMFLYVSGIVDPKDLERISSYGFGLNGAFLGCMGCFNIFKIKLKSGSKRMLAGLILLGTALIFFPFTEGIITSPILGVRVDMLRLIIAVILSISSIMITDLLKEDRKDRIGFV